MNLPKLGVGISFQATLADYVFDFSETFDFIEIVPDMMWQDAGRDESPRYRVNPDARDLLGRMAALKPVVAHSIGLSIGTAARFDRGHVAQIAEWRRRYAMPWHSDHLSSMHAQHHRGMEVNVGLMMPVPCDQASLDMLAGRIEHVRATVPEFLNALTRRSGCGLLLDLHNVYTNARNFGFDPYAFLSELDLTRVGEIHLSGGMELDGFYLDAHDGPCPAALWPMLDWVLARAPNVGGVVFEVFNTNFPDMGAEALAGELSRAREIWARHSLVAG
ncbi:MAG: DUF692 family protein [Candidatus Solibacter sp.]|nr:DUF692 family protein [Candidatus Solibacter sp.]